MGREAWNPLSSVWRGALAGGLLALGLALALRAPGAAAGLIPANAPAEPPHARVLLYHRVGDTRHPSTNVSTEAFRAQLQWLRDNGFTVVSTERLEAFLLRGEPLPERAVAIHFDDGYRSVYENALPVLREFGHPFTVLLPTEALDRGYPDYMTWEMVGELAGAGASFGAHGHRHLRLGAPEQGEPAEAYVRRIREELREGAERLKRRGIDARWVAYPYGEYNDTVLREAREAGFALGFSQDAGALGRGHDPLWLPRFAVVGTVAEMATFTERMGYLPLVLSDQTPPAGPVPGGALPARLSAAVAEPHEYRPDTVNVFVSELGRRESRFDPAGGRIEAQGDAILSRRLNRVLVTLRHGPTGRFALGSWLLVHPEGAP
ncbi:MAG: polysaccharide deacetylase family protein [Thermodesulfobacteriota bacterium]